MKKSSVIAVVIIIVVAVGVAAFMLFGNGGASQAPSSGTPPTQSNPAPASSATVTYTDNGFSPSTVTIAKGGTVTFQNSASDDVRVASNPHPIHNGYPTTGGCVGSTFDSCKNIAPGSSWSFTFDFSGSWGYHNHLNPSEGGTIIVQ